MTDIPTVLAFGAGGPRSHVADWSRCLAEQTHARGLGLIVADLEENLHSVIDLPITGTSITDYRDDDDCLKTATTVARQHDIIAVVGFREYSLRPTALAAKLLSKPWNSPEAISTTRTKDLCRETLRAAGLAQPGWMVFHEESAAGLYLRNRPGRWVVKPRDAFGSQGVALAQPLGADAEHLAAQALRFSDRIIVEEFVDGDEYSVEGIFIDGAPVVLGITAKFRSPLPYFVETGHLQPAPLAMGLETKLIDLARSALIAVGLTHSLFHLEAWVTPDGNVVCGEIHARTGGDWIHMLTSYRRPGLDLFGLVVDDVLGLHPRIPEADPSRSAAVWVATVPVGTIKSITGEQVALSTPGCLAVDVVASIGDPVGALTDSFNRGALVVAGTDEPTGAMVIAKAAAASITFEMDTTVAGSL